MPDDALDALIAGWMESTQSRHTRRAHRFDIAAWGKWLAVSGINALHASTDDVSAYRLSLEANGVSPSTVARRLSSLSSFYKFAAGQGAVHANPAGPSPRIGLWYRGKTVQPLTLGEARAFLAAADAATPRVAAIAHMALEAALTTSEVAAAAISDLVSQDGYRPLMVTRARGRQPVPLPQPTVIAIGRAAAGRTDGPIVVTRTGRRLADSAIYRDMQRVATAAAIGRPVPPCVLRATFQAIALHEGAELADVQIHLGLLPTPPHKPLSERLARSPAYRVAAALQATQ